MVDKDYTSAVISDKMSRIHYLPWYCWSKEKKNSFFFSAPLARLCSGPLGFVPPWLMCGTPVSPLHFCICLSAQYGVAIHPSLHNQHYTSELCYQNMCVCAWVCEGAPLRRPASGTWQGADPIKELRQRERGREGKGETDGGVVGSAPCPS